MQQGRGAIGRCGVLALAVALSSGCVIQVVRGNPRPNIDLPSSKAALTFVLDPAVPNEFAMPDQGGIRGANVTINSTIGAGYTAAGNLTITTTKSLTTTATGNIGSSSDVSDESM